MLNLYPLINNKSIQRTYLIHFQAKSMSFADGVRQIDYVIAFTIPPVSSVAEELQQCFINLLQHGVDIEVSK